MSLSLRDVLNLSESLDLRTLSIAHNSNKLKNTTCRKQIQFLKRFVSYFELRTMNKVLKASDSECHTPSSEAFTFYRLNPCKKLKASCTQVTAFIHSSMTWSWHENEEGVYTKYLVEKLHKNRMQKLLLWRAGTVYFTRQHKISEYINIHGRWCENPESQNILLWKS
jgi:hypothetical protein